jgi:hypothetical protein
MKHRFLTAVGLLALAGAPAVFAGDRYDDRRDLRQDYTNLARKNGEIRQDQHRLHRDLDNGRYRRAARDRAELRHDFAQRNAQRRDIHRDRRDIRHDEYNRWR